MTRKRKIILFTSVVIAGCVATAVHLIATRYDYPLAAREYDKAFAEFQKAGFQYKEGAFAQNLLAPTPADDGTQFVTEAMQSMNYPRPQPWVAVAKKRIPKLRKARDYKGLLKELEKARKPLALMVKASTYEKCTYMPYDSGALLGEWLTARAEAKAGLKDTDGAMRDLQAGFKLATARRLGNFSSAIAKGALRCAVLLKNDPQSLQTIADLLTGITRMEMAKQLRESSGYFLNTIKTGDIKMIEGDNPLLSSYLTPSTPPPPPSVWENTDKKIISWVPVEMRRKAYLTRAFQLLLEWDQMLRKNEDDLLALDRELERFEKKMLSRTAKSWTFIQMYGPMMSSRPHNVYRDTYGPYLAELRTIAACAQALIEKQRTGTFPTQTTYKDPFTNQRLKLKQTPQDLTIYSVGQNQKDDQGKADDITATLP